MPYQIHFDTNFCGTNDDFIADELPDDDLLHEALMEWIGATFTVEELDDEEYQEMLKSGYQEFDNV